MLPKIPIPFDEFKKVLDANEKVLFSGIFGSGKTTFLNDFFTDNERYESLHLYPVNYSIASNEDIFELIKYDILFQLIGKVPKEEFLKLDIPYELTLYTYLTSTLDLQPKLDFLSSFLNFAGKHGKAFLEVYEQLKKLKDKFLEFHAEFQEDDFSKVENYLKEAVNKKGHIYEEDFFTELIRILVTQISKQTNKELILVIDDLDRLDPDHIFRILNIFSAHIDFLGVDNNNKFDFDKTVLVCDYGNLESVFKHRYGLGTDFKGYINKFYSAIFWFDVISLIKGVIETYLSKIKTNLEYDIINENYRFRDQIKFILFTFFDLGIISFRDLISFTNVFDINRFYSNKKRNLSEGESLLRRYNLTAEITINFLISFFNNNQELLKALDKAETRSNGFLLNYDKEDYFNNIIEFVLLIHHNKFKALDFKSTRIWDFNNFSFTFNIELSRKDSTIFTSSVSIERNREEVAVDELNYFQFLKEATKTYLGIIK